ncbi:MAG TPA: serine acetyltransferase [Thermoleophilia bacterium]|nr:serine acetyltransferase [Thermoleophilia bacterium]
MTGHEIADQAASQAETCHYETNVAEQYRERLEAVSEEIIRDCSAGECHTHIGFEPIPSRQAIIQIIDSVRELLFPGFFSQARMDPVNFRYAIGQVSTGLFDLLSEQITRGIRHDCLRFQRECNKCEERGYEAALKLLASIPEIRRLVATDIRATFDGDPAAKSTDEIVYAYPGLQATAIYRVAHKLLELEVPMLPRMMTERMHGITGIDVHPGAVVGEGFVIDHGTGVVIGETTHIGSNVRIYQGVTVGALSLPKGAGDQYRGKKRHPTIEDDVIIYSGATILGGDTVIGARSVIGGNVWLTESVPPDTAVFMENPRLIKKARNSGA